MIKSYAGTYILSYQYSKVTVLYVFIEPVTCHCILYFVQSETAMARKTLDLIDSYDAIIVATAQHIYQGYGILSLLRVAASLVSSPPPCAGLLTTATPKPRIWTIPHKTSLITDQQSLQRS